MTLSDRQKSIMERIVAGRRAGEIATEFSLSESTVQAHMQRARAKLGAATMPQAAVLFDRLQRAAA